MLLSDDEIDAIADKCFVQYMNDENDAYDLAFARAIEAAILAKLASAELPEPQQYPAECFMQSLQVCDAVAVSIAIQKARAQGFAAGAAAQLAEKPSAFQLRDEEASEHYGREIYVLYSVFDFKDGANIGNIEKVLTPLYTRREA